MTVETAVDGLILEKVGGSANLAHRLLQLSGLPLIRTGIVFGALLELRRRDGRKLSLTYLDR